MPGTLVGTAALAAHALRDACRGGDRQRGPDGEADRVGGRPSAP